MKMAIYIFRIYECQAELDRSETELGRNSINIEQYYSRKLINDTGVYIEQFLKDNEALRNTVDQLQEHNESLRVIF
jgi:hypothetical protein